MFIIMIKIKMLKLFKISREFLLLSHYLHTNCLKCDNMQSVFCCNEISDKLTMSHNEKYIVIYM